MRSIFTLTFLFFLTSAAVGQIPYSEEQFRVFDGKGNPASVADIVKAAGRVDVVFLGEQHDDPVGHAIEMEVFRRIFDEYGAKRKVTLSLEMFESDVQIILNEYLSSLILEPQFLAGSRPWANYKSDYRPLVELAKEKKLEVVAANAPRRYVNMVSRGGRAKLNLLSRPAKTWLPPLPYGQPSEAYAKKFKARMGPSPEARMGIDNILSSQSLWDASMAYSVAKRLKTNRRSLVVHLNGSFHTESRLGTVEHLLKYRPKTRVLVVTMQYADDFKTFDKAKHTGIGDFVILTDRKPKVLSELLRRMGDHNKALKSLRSNVTMIKHNAQINESDTSVGNVNYLPKTGSREMYIRVDWIKPVQQQLVLIGDTYELYRPHLNQVIYGKTLNFAALSFLSMSKDQLKANHTISYLGEEQISGGVKTWHLQIIPKTTTTYKTAEVWVDADGMPRQVKVNEPNGDSTTVLLSNIQKNITLNAEIFDLKLPKTVKRIKA